jgi:tellurite resistance protein TehA-like permease
VRLSTGQRVRGAVRGLNPGYFALVMASGILSIGMRLNGVDGLSAVLEAVCALAYVVLAGLTVWRLVCIRDAVVDDFTDPARGFGFFTFIAGTNVLGVRLAMDGLHQVTAGLLAVAALTWLVLGYVIPWTAVLGRTQRPVVVLANGTWFIWWWPASRSRSPPRRWSRSMSGGATRWP